METFENIISWLENIIWNYPESFPAMVVILLAFGIYITVRLGFVQFTRFKHGLKVVTGFYDDPEDEGDINHFQALTTALSATVGIGNIAGVALAIHYGGPGALFWMWVTALLGMAIKFTEVTLAQEYRSSNPDGTVSGGPMYYIERGLGSNWKWLAVAFAISAAICAFLTGNAVQANTVADVMKTDFQIPVVVTGFITASLVAAVILGGIKRIGRVTSRLVPFMGILYVLGALAILLINYQDVLPSLGLIVSNAFNPQAGALGVGSGALIFTLSYGVQRGLFSNEAGQGSAPIAHSAAKTDQPVREGVVALLEPFIDTLVICTMTGLVIVSTGAWDMHHQSAVDPADDVVTYELNSAGNQTPNNNVLYFKNGVPQNGIMNYYGISVDTMFTNASFSEPFNGRIELSGDQVGVYAEDDSQIPILYGGVVQNGAPLTSAAFEKGLAPIFPGGGYIVTIAVFLFAVSTSISWSYYGDRAAQYLFGFGSIFWYRLTFVAMHFLGALFTITVVWNFGDVMLGLMAFFNIVALFALSGAAYKITKKYFENPDV
ncbi:sodium:alanine symporter family protein [Aliifodinibius sp. S!AR15-10]|uniref:alanine/glycine:cation symporter family protein n=1 Tax=Aliifodinibius sp. S!AR15-10 TaxID=2950437 RepID=UPI002857BC96|nr:sodium:alanine symporter family protein [Aliifodinibius sp. S!AR15-10]MDR8390407.1 sodium:alanine symporter family protein [Aliifodinibius sp. S!AR15-10]